ncbi:MAG TPA: glycoside hydrolase family 2 [Rikenellaceae bacterium]|nr:glycoside hydrolase family 2 [Rikenellaceae bacterium]
MRKLLVLLFVLFSIVLPAQDMSGGTCFQREKIRIDKDWKFAFGHSDDFSKDFDYGHARMFAKTAENFGTAIRADFNDSSWEDVDLPHDWAVGLPVEYSPNGDVKSHGYKTVGAGLYPDKSIGWYRKTLSVPELKGRRAVLHFDGIFRDSEVWVNNIYCGRHFSGYTGVTYDISDFVNPGSDNLIVVRVDASKFEGWWYEGAGIYRHVWLELFSPLHFAEYGVALRPVLSKSFDKAQIYVSYDVENDLELPSDFSLTTEIFSPSGTLVATSCPINARLSSGEVLKFETSLSLLNPELWDIDTPRMYKAKSYIISGRDTLDVLTEKFGIRDIRVSADSGLFLNGRNIRIKGVCCHQDHAGIGTALPDYMQYYRISLLKDMGANAYRASHNPPTPELLDACDSLGMLVLDEVRALNSSSEYMSQFESLVRRDRNHPSVFMWSLGNEEERLQTKGEGRRIALSMMRKIRALDPSRTFTYGANVGNDNNGVNSVIPVRGFNYNLYALDDYHEANPSQPIIGSEVGSTVTTRGVYTKDTVRCYLTDRDENYPSWATTAENWWKIALERPWLIGGFVWTGFDYRGEPTPFAWPNVNSHFGIMDMCGFPKNLYYYYQSWWTDKDVLHISPHWNWPGKEGDGISVWVNSNADEVELFCNGRSFGRQIMPRGGHLEWTIPYQPGTLKAEAYKGGRKIVKTVSTTGKPYKIVLEPTASFHSNVNDAVVLNVSVVDRQGRAVPDASDYVSFDISGQAFIAGVGNGDPSCHEPEVCMPGKWGRSLFAGACQIIVRRDTIGSHFRLVARAKGLVSDEIDL